MLYNLETFKYLILKIPVSTKSIFEILETHNFDHYHYYHHQYIIHFVSSISLESLDQMVYYVKNT